MASTELTKTPDAALPPGAANVEDDLRAFEAEERRSKLKLMAARITLAIVLLVVWEYGTDRWFDALWFSSPLRVARHFMRLGARRSASASCHHAARMFHWLHHRHPGGDFCRRAAGAIRFSRQGARPVHSGAQRHPAHRAGAAVHHLVRNRRAVEDRARRHAVVLFVLLRDALRVAQRRSSLYRRSRA